MRAYKKKLIEVALPLDAINKEAAREKSIRNGHPSTLHIWWARRPLAACRAVLFAQMVDDPSAHPDKFPTEEDQEHERQRLFRIIEELVKWENRNNEAVLVKARAEIRKSCDGKCPPVYDPFSGGGSIPLEAQRLGLKAYGSDLNPVAVIIGKALVEIPPRFADKPPINPAAQNNSGLGGAWSSKGAQGLAEDVRYYSHWIRDEAKKQVGHLYKPVPLPAKEGVGKALVIAWIWARTVQCRNPVCGIHAPLLHSLSLSSRKKNEHSLRPVSQIPGAPVLFDIVKKCAPRDSGSVSRSGGRCLACNTAIPLAYIRGEGKSGRLGVQPVAIVVKGNRRRIYLPGHSVSEDIPKLKIPHDILDTNLPEAALGFSVQGYGITKHRDLFTPRQLIALNIFSHLVVEARKKIVADGAEKEYADAVTTYLALAIGRLANRCSSQCFWNPGGEKVEQVFSRNAMPIIWAFAEANPFSTSTGNFLGQVKYLTEALAQTPATGFGSIRQRDAARIEHNSPVVFSTDPPYYDNIPFADLSDFFYVWLRRSASKVYSDLFRTLLVPKQKELVAEPARHNNAREAADFFENGLRSVFKKIVSLQHDDYPVTIFYAFKQSEEHGDGNGRSSTGWEKMLKGLMDQGLQITGTWPVRTERKGGLRDFRRNSLASSILLACRKRPKEASTITRAEFIKALHREIPLALKLLQHGNIAPVDMAQASIGPGMAIFTRYSRVLESDDSLMTVRVALQLINAALDEYLSEQETEYDSDTRFAITWFETHGMEMGSYGKAETLATARGVAVSGVQEAGIVESRGGKVRLLKREEIPEDWDPTADSRPTVWEATQHLIRVLQNRGEQEAADLLAKLGSTGEAAKDLAYRLYGICEHKKWADEGLAYNNLAISWPELTRLAATSGSGGGSQEEMVF